MKTIPAGLQAHLAGGATTMAYCWLVTRQDGAVLGFTEHDEDIVYAGHTFAASSGFTASKIVQGLGLSIDNLEASGALSSASISEADILAGRYDDATIDLFWVNWSNPGQGITVSSGTLGEVKCQGAAFQAELRSLSSRLNQKIGLTYERRCSARLGDARCTIDLTAAAYGGPLSVITGGTSRVMTVLGLSGFASDWFTFGTLVFGTGANRTIPFEIKAHRRTAGVDILELWIPPPFPVASGDTGQVRAGCRKNLTTCLKKFDNGANFRGFPHIPGVDVVTRYGVQGALGQTGGSIFGNDP